jgi:hypothetical protein
MGNDPKRKQPTKSLGPKHWDPDTGAQEVPTLTSLMNRKKLEVSKGSKPSTPKIQIDEESLFERGSPTPVAEKPKSPSASKSASGDITLADADASEQGFEIESNQLKTNAYLSRPSSAPAPGAKSGNMKLASKAAAPDRRGSRPKLSIWTPETLKQGKEPYEKALQRLLGRGLTSALYLQGDQRAPFNQKLPPIFIARIAFGSRQQLAVWNGLRWDPEASMKLWNELYQASYLELVPPSAGIPSPAPNPRTFLRSAFGVDPQDMLTLVRIGSGETTHGMLALLSRSSLKEEIESLLSTLVTGTKLRKSA